MLPRDRVDIAKAVYFLEAVSRGDIKCKNPTATVAQKFNVTPQAVRNWRKASTVICDGIPKPHPNMIGEAMLHAGIKYSVRGRGAPSPE